MRFEPSPNARVDVLPVGGAPSPVIQIDKVLCNPEDLVRFAEHEAQFSTVDSNLYPGIRAAMPLDYVEGAVRALDPLIRVTYQISDAKLASAECFFSIVTTPPAKLKPLQKVPHIDTTDNLHFAVVHFLCAGPFGGTAFYRQNSTGFERITAERENQWAKARDEGLATIGDEAGYVDDATEGYHQIALIKSKFDRLTLYPSNLLHSGLIPIDMPFSSDPAVGRLTANFFIGYRLA